MTNMEALRENMGDDGSEREITITLNHFYINDKYGMQRLYFYSNFKISVVDVLEYIVDNRFLTSLTVDVITLVPAIMRSLIRVVEQNKTITSITVSEVHFYKGALGSLLDAMTGNEHVERLDLSNNDTRRWESPIDWESMFKMLSGNKTLLEFSMSGGSMGSGMVQAMSRGMMLNKRIKKWSIEGCRGWNGGGDVFDTMAVVLDTNSTLEEVRMGGNNCCKRSLEALLESVSRNSSLRHLGLEESLSVRRGEISWNWISGLVAKTLACNTSLNHLDITDVITNNRFATHLDEIVILQALVDHPRDQAFVLGMCSTDEDEIQSWLEKAVEFPENGDNVMECIANDWDQKERRLVFMDGLHPMLGKGSIVRLLDIELVEKICKFQIC
jgi:hypothetical protein